MPFRVVVALLIPACSNQADTRAPGEQSRIKRDQPISREQGTAPGEFVRVASEISLTQSTYQIVANKSSGRWPACPVADIWQD